MTIRDAHVHVFSFTLLLSFKRKIGRSIDIYSITDSLSIFFDELFEFSVMIKKSIKSCSIQTCDT